MTARSPLPYVEALRRIADLIEQDVLPVPSTATRLAWYVHGDDPRGQANAIAAALGGQWQADSQPGSDYLAARSTLVPGDGYSGVIDVRVSMEHKHPQAQPAPAVIFAAEVNAAAARGEATR